MSIFVKQATLPLELFEKVSRARSRYQEALAAAAREDYSRQFELRSLSRYLGRLLATQARKRTEERGGLTLLDISLTIDKWFPELRGWNQHIALQWQRKRLQEAPVVLPTPKRVNKAS